MRVSGGSSVAARRSIVNAISDPGMPRMFLVS
jgi:hypothetical protein